MADMTTVGLSGLLTLVITGGAAWGKFVLDRRTLQQKDHELEEKAEERQTNLETKLRDELRGDLTSTRAEVKELRENQAETSKKLRETDDCLHETRRQLRETTEALEETKEALDNTTAALVAMREDRDGWKQMYETLWHQHGELKLQYGAAVEERKSVSDQNNVLSREVGELRGMVESMQKRLNAGGT